MTRFMLHGLGDCTADHHCGCLATQPPAVDHTQAIADAAREYVRAINTWISGAHPHPYPAAAEEALIAAVEAEHPDKEYKP